MLKVQELRDITENSSRKRCLVEALEYEMITAAKVGLDYYERFFLLQVDSLIWQEIQQDYNNNGFQFTLYWDTDSTQLIKLKVQWSE